MHSFTKLALLAITATTTVVAHERANVAAHERASVVARQTEAWHHPAGHPIERLFKRSTAATPTFGSPGTSAFPLRLLANSRIHV